MRMPEYDLSEAVEAAARARWSRTRMSAQRQWEDMPDAFRDRVRTMVATEDIAAALPVIERQVREQVAKEIEACESAHFAIPGGDLIFRAHAARIARGDS